jgi:hypothetical protein
MLRQQPSAADGMSSLRFGEHLVSLLFVGRIDLSYVEQIDED